MVLNQLASGPQSDSLMADEADEEVEGSGEGSGGGSGESNRSGWDDDDNTDEYPSGDGSGENPITTLAPGSTEPKGKSSVIRGEGCRSGRQAAREPLSQRPFASLHDRFVTFTHRAVTTCRNRAFVFAGRPTDNTGSETKTNDKDATAGPKDRPSGAAAAHVVHGLTMTVALLCSLMVRQDGNAPINYVAYALVASNYYYYNQRQWTSFSSLLGLSSSSSSS